MVLYVSYSEIGEVKVSNLKPADGAAFDGPFKNKWDLIKRLNELHVPNSKRPKRYKEHTNIHGFFKKREVPKCSECPDNITIEEAYQGSPYCHDAIQAGKCPKFEWRTRPPATQ